MSERSSSSERSTERGERSTERGERCRRFYGWTNSPLSLCLPHSASVLGLLESWLDAEEGCKFPKKYVAPARAGWESGEKRLIRIQIQFKFNSNSGRFEVQTLNQSTGLITIKISNITITISKITCNKVQKQHTAYNIKQTTQHTTQHNTQHTTHKFKFNSNSIQIQFKFKFNCSKIVI